MNQFQEYLLPFLAEDAIKRTLREQEKTRQDVAPSVGPETGRLLMFLVHVLKAKNVLEIGTCQGYSTLWLAEGLKITGGKITSIETNEKIIKETKETFLRAGFKNVNFIIDDALKVLPTFPSNSFDLILQDSMKSLYSTMLDDCIRLLRIGGILVSDDILFKAMGKRASIANAMHEYNQKLNADNRLITTYLSIGDGVALSIKIKE